KIVCVQAAYTYSSSQNVFQFISSAKIMKPSLDRQLESSQQMSLNKNWKKNMPTHTGTQQNKKVKKDQLGLGPTSMPMENRIFPATQTSKDLFMLEHDDDYDDEGGVHNGGFICLTSLKRTNKKMLHKFYMELDIGTARIFDLFNQKRGNCRKRPNLWHNRLNETKGDCGWRMVNRGEEAL
ncbi:Hypothetical predicted protein, partial [Drosophila guanche]